MTNHDSIYKKQRHYFVNKGPSSQGYGFSNGHVWMWVKLLRKLSAEELMLLNCGVEEDSWVPWTTRRSNQSILKEISPGCSLEGLMLKLKLQYFGHLTWRADSLEKTLILGGIGGRRRREQWRMRWLDGNGHRFGWTLGVGDGQGGLACCGSWGRKESDMTEWLNWNELEVFSYQYMESGFSLSLSLFFFGCSMWLAGS